jgi:hypothetical protein
MTAELEWREAADVMLLLGAQAVVEAGTAHVEATWRRRDGACGSLRQHPSPVLAEALSSYLYSRPRP